MFHFFFSKKKFHCLSLWLFSSCDDSGHLQFLVVRWSAFVGKVTNPGHMANSGCRSRPPTLVAEAHRRIGHSVPGILVG